MESIDHFAPRLTCGLVIHCPEGWLLGRSTGLGHWDLPKGKREGNESRQQAALRECLEETGLDFSAWQDHLVDLGERNYHRKRGKRLQLFGLNLDHVPSLEQCKCSTWVHTRGPTPVRDMDAWAWVAPELVGSMVKRRMAKHLRKRGLI